MEALGGGACRTFLDPARSALRAVADARHEFSARVEFFREIEYLSVGPHYYRVPRAAGNYDRVIVFDFRLRYLSGDGYPYRRPEEFDGHDPVFYPVWGYNFDDRAAISHVLDGIGGFYFFEAVGRMLKSRLFYLYFFQFGSDGPGASD